MTADDSQQSRAVVVMGVAGCGKSSVAAALARALNWTMIEGDLFHSAANRARMQAGIALTDSDRMDWLRSLAQELQRHPQGVVLSCSALKRCYRDMLRDASPGLRFVFLDLSPELAQQRVKARGPAHYFNPSLVASQFQTLESPIGEAGVLRVDASQSVEASCAIALRWLTKSSHA